MKHYTETQERTLEWLETVESRESLSSITKFICKCNTCDKVETLSSAGTVSALFMSEHIGHSTFIKKV